MLLESIEEKGYPYLFNIYVYHEQLIGIEEDPKFLQLFEMGPYGSPEDYFDWRVTQVDFGSLLDVKGFPIAKTHEKYRTYRKYLSSAELAYQIRRRRWRDRLRK